MGIKVWESSDLKKTCDYDMFKYLEYNREVDHVRRLEKSVLEIGQVPIPIIINENNEIIDGQHRFEVWKKLELPVFYIVVPGLSLMQCGAINSASKTWSTKNYIHSYTSPEYENNDSYIYYELLTDEFNSIKATIMSSIVAPLYKVSGKKTRALIKDKKIILQEDDYRNLEEKCKWFSELLAELDGKLSGGMEGFWDAISYAYEMDKVDNSQLKKKVIAEAKAGGEGLVPADKFKPALRKLGDVYNKGKKQRKVYFEAEYDNFEPKYAAGVKPCD